MENHDFPSHRHGVMAYKRGECKCRINKKKYTETTASPLRNLHVTNRTRTKPRPPPASPRTIPLSPLSHPIADPFRVFTIGRTCIFACGNLSRIPDVEVNCLRSLDAGDVYGLKCGGEKKGTINFKKQAIVVTFCPVFFDASRRGR